MENENIIVIDINTLEHNLFDIFSILIDSNYDLNILKLKTIFKTFCEYKNEYHQLLTKFSNIEYHQNININDLYQMANTLKTISTEIENITTFYFKRLNEKENILCEANDLFDPIKLSGEDEIINIIINMFNNQHILPLESFPIEKQNEILSVLQLSLGEISNHDYYALMIKGFLTYVTSTTLEREYYVQRAISNKKNKFKS